MNDSLDRGAGAPPRHVAIILDDSDDWAPRNDRPLAGERAGAEQLRAIAGTALRLGIRYLTLVAPAAEHSPRPPAEARALPDRLAAAVEHEAIALHRANVRLRHVGSLAGLSPRRWAAIQEAAELTRRNTALDLTLAVDVDGRAEIVRAARRLLEEAVAPDAITEERLGAVLDTADLPDPDLLIRTAGVQRPANALIWQAAYSEYWFTPRPWPDFGPAELEGAVAAYGRRQRKFGRVLGG